MTKTSFWQRLFRGTQKVQAQSDWMHAMDDDWPEHIMDASVTDNFHAKQGRSTGRLELSQHLSVYLKRHYRLPRWRGVMATLWPRRAWSPAWHEAQHLEWARNNGFLVPDVLAAVEYIGPRFRLQSLLAVRELQDMLPLHQAIPLAAHEFSPTVFSAWKLALIRELARVTSELHGKKCFHKDLYLCHFYLPRSCCTASSGTTAFDFEKQLYMIDLHRLARHRWTFAWWLFKDLAQLAYSTHLDEITPRDRVLFWRLYRKGAKRTLATKLLERIVNLRWMRYQDHNQKRKRKTESTQERSREAA